MSFEVKQSFQEVFNVPRSLKTFIAVSLDTSACFLSIWLSYYLRLGYLVPIFYGGIDPLIYSVVFSLPIFSFFGLYRAVVRYSGLYNLIISSKSILIYGICFSFIVSFIGINGVPRTIGFIQPLLLLFFISSWRLIAQFLLKSNSSELEKIDFTNALIYGSGEAGRQLVRAMQESKDISIKGFIDDDFKREGLYIYGKRIHSPKELKKLIIKKKINLILLALPSISRKRRNEIVSKLSKFKIAVRSIPGIYDLARGKSQISNITDLEIDDLLGRNEVKPFELLMKKNIYSKSILVTGSGGSIGSELCRQIINLNPKKLILLEISEYALYAIHSEMKLLVGNEIELIPLIGSVQDIKRIDHILSIWKPFTIYHAAGYKHVPIVEHNLIEGIKNNFLGTYDFAKISIKNKVTNFVFISTDKAVRPTNIMGASKRLAEMSLQALSDKIKEKEDKKSTTKFSIVRFGNVLDSSGSVIPKFREQIRQGGPITLTHKKITRYFMTITEAAQLVIQAGAMSRGGDVFVLDMGEPVKIYDLALKMIQLSGLSLKNSKNQKGNIEILVTGLRPGEKLYEELLLSDNPLKTKHPKIFRSDEPYLKLDEFEKEIISLRNLIEDNNHKNILLKLEKLVNDFAPSNQIVDYTFNENM